MGMESEEDYGLGAASALEDLDEEIERVPLGREKNMEMRTWSESDENEQASVIKCSRLVKRGLALLLCVMIGLFALSAITPVPRKPSDGEEKHTENVYQVDPPTQGQQGGTKEVNTVSENKCSWDEVGAGKTLKSTSCKFDLGVGDDQIHKVSQVVLSLGATADNMVVRFTVEEVAKESTDDRCSEPSQKLYVKARRKQTAAKVWQKEAPKVDHPLLISQADHVGCIHSQEEKKKVWHYYVATLQHLTPGARYMYEIGAPESKAAARQLELRVPPESNPRFLCVGDTEPKKFNIMPALQSQALEKADVWIHVGDMSYASNDGGCYGDMGQDPNCSFKCPRDNPNCGGRKSLVHAELFKKWATFLDRIEPISSRIPLITTMGNHDNDVFWFLKFRPPHASSNHGVPPNMMSTELNKRLALFQTEYKGRKYEEQKGLLNEALAEPFFYSANVGPVHIVCIKSEDNGVDPYERVGNQGSQKSSELTSRTLPEALLRGKAELDRFDAHFGHGSAQFKWLEYDLSRVDRKKTPFVIVFTHRPIFHNNNHHPLCSRGGDWYMCNFRDLYAPTYQKYNVNLIMSGHSHHYMFSSPIKYEGGVASVGQPGQNPVYTIVGTGGYELSQRFLPKPEFIKEASANNFGYALLEPETTQNRMKWVYYTITGADVTPKKEEYIQAFS